jgi:hypothetical protein
MAAEDHLLPGALGPELPLLPGEVGETPALPGEVGEDPPLVDDVGAPPEPWIDLSPLETDEPATIGVAEAEAVLERITRPRTIAPGPPRALPIARPPALTPTRGGRRRVWPWGAVALLLCGAATWLVQAPPPTGAPPSTPRLLGSDEADRAQRMLDLVRFSERRALGG